MRDEYDFSTAERNPYAQASKVTVALRLEVSTVEYFKRLSEEMNLPYETLISSCLADCADQKRKPALDGDEIAIHRPKFWA